MSVKRRVDWERAYVVLGVVLCAISGAIVAFIYGGATLAVFGAFAGWIIGRWLAGAFGSKNGA